MIPIRDYISQFPSLIPCDTYGNPWDLTASLSHLLETLLPRLNNQFIVNEGVAIHKTAIVEKNVTFKGPIIVMGNCFIAANAYFRDGVFLDASVKIGPGCEVKSSYIGAHSALAHFNYVGNSLIGERVNFEAGSIAANHYNERAIKNISINYKGSILDTGAAKFGALVGDHTKIGANAVLSPGTILAKNSIVQRLELVEQIAMQ